MKAPRERFKELDWLFVLLVSWALPFVLVHWRPGRGYFRSLVFWFVPILFLGWHYLSLAKPNPTLDLGYSRRRRALRGAILYISGLGLILDFLLGSFILRFDEANAKAQYVLMVPGLGIRIPVEELLFYALAPAAIVLVYAWADEYWLDRYSPQDRREAIAPETLLISPSPTVLASAVVLLCLGMVYKAAWGPGDTIIPAYFSFLVVSAFVPAALLFGKVRDYVNWRAFAVTTLYVICTSLLWETTLAIPRKWWGYRADTRLGPVIPDWSHDGWIFPIEAVLVWVCAPFSCVLTYEYIKAARYRASAVELSRR